MDISRLVLLQLFFYSCSHENDAQLNFFLWTYSGTRRKANRESTARDRVPVAVGNTYILFWAYWLSFLTFLQDTKATRCCLWHIFLILSKFLTTFWKPFGLKSLIQHKLNLLKVTCDAPCNPSASFPTRSYRDKETRQIKSQRFGNQNGSQNQSLEK